MKKTPATKLGNTVITPAGPGTVTDRADGEALVRMESGTILDTSHGQWWSEKELTVTGHNPDALVWRGARMKRAGD